MKKRRFIIASIVIAFLLTMTSCIGKKYEIRFDTNGGSYIESQEVKKRKKVEKPDDPLKEGYTFLYWELDGKEYDFGQKVKKSFTLVAKWDALTFTIDYNTNGGINNSDNITKIKSDEEFVLKQPKRPGYDFDGWFADDKFNEKVTKISVGTTKNISLYAKWCVQTSEIHYNLAGGINAEENPNTFTIEDELTLYSPKKEGYIFDGWYKEKECINKWDFEIDTVKLEENIEEIKLYAKWIEE